MKNHPCWATAMHEASHIAVYTQLGGRWGSGKAIHIHPEYGGVTLGGLGDFEYGFFLDFCVYAAGLAADRIQGIPSCDGRGSDKDSVKWLAVDYQLSAADVALIIDKIENWLRKYNPLITVAAESLINARDKHGNVPKTQSIQIVKRLVDGLIHRRKLVTRRRRKTR